MYRLDSFFAIRRPPVRVSAHPSQSASPSSNASDVRQWRPLSSRSSRIARRFVYGRPVTSRPFDAEHVERDERQRGRRSPQEHAVAQLQEVRLSEGAKNDKLPVEHAPRRKRSQERDMLAHVPPCRLRAQRALRRDDRAESVPLQFVGVVAARQQLTGACEHRFRKAAVRRHRRVQSLGDRAYLSAVYISPRSRRAFADMAAWHGTVYRIERWYEDEGFERDPAFDLPESGVRRATIDAYESRIDWTDEAQNNRVLRVYANAIEDAGRALYDRTLAPEAVALVRALVRDGAEEDDEGGIRAPLPARPAIRAELPLEGFARLEDPAVLREHLRRIDRDLADDPSAAIGSCKELLESVFKLVLEDYRVEYSNRDDVLELYKKAADALRLNAESVPDSARGSQSAQRALRSLVTTVQSLAELRNELGLGHGRAEPSPALERHAKLAFHATRAVSEFVLETWHVRRAAEEQ